jgi:hypothetical protein
MRAIIARCGNRCDLCPLYKDNFTEGAAEKITADLYKYHQANQGPRPIYTRACDGCLSKGYVARERCRIRECATGRGFATCAECESLFCTLLESDMEIVEGALARCATTMPREDYERYFQPFLIREVLLSLRSSKRKATGT